MSLAGQTARPVELLPGGSDDHDLYRPAKQVPQNRDALVIDPVKRRSSPTPNSSSHTVRHFIDGWMDGGCSALLRFHHGATKVRTGCQDWLGQGPVAPLRKALQARCALSQAVLRAQTRSPRDLAHAALSTRYHHWRNSGTAPVQQMPDARRAHPGGICRAHARSSFLTRAVPRPRACGDCGAVRMSFLVRRGATVYHAGMSALRLITVLVLLLTLPVYGLAGVLQRSCQQEMTASTPVTLAGDCCPGKSDPGTSCKRLSDSPLGKKGSCTACKAGYNCKSPQSYEPAPALVWLVLPARSTVSIDPPALLASHSPDGLWRPPRSI
jgi:hypothetical protein